MDERTLDPFIVFYKGNCLEKEGDFFWDGRWSLLLGDYAEARAYHMQGEGGLASQGKANYYGES